MFSRFIISIMFTIAIVLPVFSQDDEDIDVARQHSFGIMKNTKWVGTTDIIGLCDGNVYSYKLSLGVITKTINQYGHVKVLTTTVVCISKDTSKDVDKVIALYDLSDLAINDLKKLCGTALTYDSLTDSKNIKNQSYFYASFIMTGLNSNGILQPVTNRPAKCSMFAIASMVYLADPYTVSKCNTNMFFGKVSSADCITPLLDLIDKTIKTKDTLTID